MKTRWAIGEEILGRYEVEHIYHGGMGTVYIAFDPLRRERYAVKSPHDRILSRDVLRRFIREANIWVDLGDHPNIVRAMFVERPTASTLLLFLEYVEGSNLRERLSADGIDLAQTVDFAIQFCNGAHYAYEKIGMVHRDIKPENVMITPEGLVKVTDFGLAKAFSAFGAEAQAVNVEGKEVQDPRLTQEGAVLGTYPYMSLEQLRGDADVGLASDVYSFGVMLYEMLTRQLPFTVSIPVGLRPKERGGYYVRALIDHQMKQRPAAPSFILRQSLLPGRLDRLVMTCLESRAERRFPDFAAIKKELVAIYEDLMEKRVEEESRLRTMILSAGIASSEAERYEEAIATYDAILKVNPRDIAAWHNKANAIMNIAQYQTASQGPPPDDEGQDDRFSGMLQQYQSAIRCSERSLELNPNYDLAWNTKGGCLVLSGRFHRALECFDCALSLNPDYGAAWYNRGTCLRRLGRYQEALDSYDRALQVDPNHANAWNGKGVCLGEMENYPAALESFDRALAIDPQHAQARTGRAIWGKLAVGMKDFAVWVPRFAPDLSAHFASVLGNGESDLPPRRRPNDNSVLELTDRAWGLKNLGKFGEAIQCIEQALTLDPGYTTAYLHKGRILRNLKRYDEAIATFDKGLQLDPEYALLWLNKGLVYQDQGQWQEALVLIDRFIAAEPSDSAGWLNKSSVLINLNRFREAKICCDHAVKRNGEDSRAWLNKAIACKELNESEEALQCCEQAMGLDPLMEEAWLLKGRVLMDLHNKEKALSCFDKLTQIDPQNPDWWLEKASCLINIRKEPDIALDCCAKAVSLGSTKHYLLNFVMGRALYEVKRYDEAISIFDQLIVGNPKDKALWVQKATCLVQPDRWREAADCYLEALRIDPEDAEMAEFASTSFQNGYPKVMSELEKGAELLTRDPESALFWFTKARDACPQWWEIWDKMGAALMVMGSHEEAADRFLESLTVFSRSEEAWNALGTCWLNLGRFTDAVTAYDRAVSIAPDMALAWFCKGQALQSLGLLDEAAEAYANAARLDPDFPSPLDL